MAFTLGISSPNISVRAPWHGNNNTWYLYSTPLCTVQLILTTPSIGRVGILFAHCHRKEPRSGETSYWPTSNENSGHWTAISFPGYHPQRKGLGGNRESGLIFIEYPCQCIAVLISFNIYNSLGGRNCLYLCSKDKKIENTENSSYQLCDLEQVASAL